MGPQRILQTTRRLTLALLALSSVAVAAPKERVAVIDVGPPDRGEARRIIAAAVVDGGLRPLAGDGIDTALAGQDIAADAITLAAAMAEAQRAFGALDCPATLTAAKLVIGIASARQAAGLAVPELARGWTYVLLCADRSGDATAAHHAANQLRAGGGDVPADVVAKYPEVDALLDRELFSLEVSADIAGAAIWIDGKLVGTAPVAVKLRAGEHVIAAALGERRGFAAGTASTAQTKLVVPTAPQRGPYGAIAKRVASWGSETPGPSELAAIFDATRTRVAIVRKGDAIEAWGRSDRGNVPHRLGDQDGVGAIADAPRVVSLINDRVATWNAHAEDPDQPLLVEGNVPKLARSGPRDEPTKWWVYATVIGAALAGGTFLLINETAGTNQHVELHVP